MRITPLNIKKQEFGKSLRGYDTEEVRIYLNSLADDLEDLIRENETLKKNLDEANTQLLEYRRIEKNLQDTLLKAQETTSKSIESTKKQASLIIKEAEIKAQQILDKSKEGANELRNSIIVLREERDLILAKLKAIVNSQSHLLEMKIEKAVEEKEPASKLTTLKQLNINIDNIVEKLS